jgi:hypothetical protein
MAENYADDVMARLGSTTVVPPVAGGGTGGAAGGQVSGSVDVNVGLSAEARKLLTVNPGPVQTRLQSNWRPSMGY